MIPGGFHFESEVKPTENLPNFLPNQSNYDPDYGKQNENQ